MSAKRYPVPKPQFTGELAIRVARVTVNLFSEIVLKNQRRRVLVTRNHSVADSAPLALPSYNELAGHWAVKVNGNVRVTFRFDDKGNALDVNYLDYH